MCCDAVHAGIKAQQAASSEFFVDDRFMPEVAAGSTEGVGEIGSEHPQLTSAAPERRVKMALHAGLGVCGRDLVFNETRDAFAPGIEFLVGPGRP
jgi:hypothetical protein